MALTLVRNDEGQDSNHYYEGALDSMCCAMAILNTEAIVEYSNDAMDTLVKSTGKDLGFLLKLLAEKVDLASGTGSYQIRVCEKCKGIICRVMPRIEACTRTGSIVTMFKLGCGDCLTQEQEVASHIIDELNALLESSYDGVLVTDREGIVTRVNTAFEKSMMLPKGAILGQHIEVLADVGQGESVFQRAMRTKRAATSLLESNGKNLLMTVSPIVSNLGKFNGVVANVRDITELNKLKHDIEYHRMLSEEYAKELASIVRQQNDHAEFIACSEPMKRIKDMIRDIARTDATVLITGESGTGKEVVINEIYRRSLRNEMPIVKINCGAIPATLFESELFGYEDGAFTGAKKAGKPGLFETANGGTMVLDEIGELSLDLQVKLLRVIQERVVTRIGGVSSVKTDVRILAATNRNLLDSVESGTFRKDLYYRLSVIEIEIPPLRSRPDDIVPLAIHLLEKYNRKYNKQKELSLELSKRLRKMEWLGNVRELENLIEYLVIMTSSDLLEVEHMPGRYKNKGMDGVGQVKVSGVLPMKEAVREAKRQLINNAKVLYPTLSEIAGALDVDASTISRLVNQKGGEKSTDLVV